ncbi:MAG: hypothetical protein KME45_03475 [Stenomitos rutilans HA7619-LM2]|jgi:hypothetical protein|nr:hypothetical protein [Stenomitos rutilans HA7619-LM2]MBW4469446.1 hypothetical protein [Stenomitos rutilans HA7619-LM2]
MPSIHDLRPGQKYGRLKAVRLVEKCKHPVSGWIYKHLWLFKCDCGKEKITNAQIVITGKGISCGCYKSELCRTINKPPVTRHNLSHGATVGGKTPEYRIWGQMIRRCDSPKDTRFEDYGGRGIKVCDRWRKFENFIADMGLKPSSEHSIDRRDNDGDYCPENCYWATKKQQARNTRRNRFIEFNGERLTLAEWAERLGIAGSVIANRIDKFGWTVEKALTTRNGAKRILSYNGKMLSIAAWARDTGLTSGTIGARLKMGWSIEATLTRPCRFAEKTESLL